MCADSPSGRPIAGARAGAALALAFALLAARGGPRRMPARSRSPWTATRDGGWASSASRTACRSAGRPPLRDRPPGNTAGNQVQPLLLSTQGRYVWSEEPFRLAFPRRDDPSGLGPRTPAVGAAGHDAARSGPARGPDLLPPSGKTPDPMLFTHPQFNTWIELTYDQNQRDVLA